MKGPRIDASTCQERLRRCYLPFSGHLGGRLVARASVIADYDFTRTTEMTRHVAHAARDSVDTF